jgi:hypothetical protein
MTCRGKLTSAARRSVERSHSACRQADRVGLHPACKRVEYFVDGHRRLRAVGFPQRTRSPPRRVPTKYDTLNGHGKQHPGGRYEADGCDDELVLFVTPSS